MDFKLAGGNSTLVCALADSVGRNRIHTKFVVRKIHQDSNGVEVFPTKGQPLSAEVCICTLPAHQLSRIDWGKAEVSAVYPKSPGDLFAGTQLMVNGTAVVADASGNWSLPVTLVLGPNAIPVKATDPAGNESTLTITVTYALPVATTTTTAAAPPPPAPTTTAKPKPKPTVPPPTTAPPTTPPPTTAPPPVDTGP